MACLEFLRMQMRSPLAIQDQYSLISFNDTASTHCASVSASCAWEVVGSLLQLQPQLGTNYVAALQEISNLIRLGKLNRNSLIRVFWLSGGRPGDWTQAAVMSLQHLIKEVQEWRSL